jgi:hypothetical protein
MRLHPVFLAPATLLLCLACQPRPAAPVAAPVYGAWEEGHTLTFEDPSLPQPQRAEERIQVRVTRSAIAPGAPRLVQLDLTSAKGRKTLVLMHQDGGIALLGEDSQVAATLLPKHFPETTAWVDHGTDYRVIGRARWEGAALLPATSDPIGVWVEASSFQGLRRRTLYLPNLGEVEAQVERAGAWVTVHRLVAQGFTDLPTTKRP